MICICSREEGIEIDFLSFPRLDPYGSSLAGYILSVTAYEIPTFNSSSFIDSKGVLT
jgi:hypothetical protein